LRGLRLRLLVLAGALVVGSATIVGIWKLANARCFQLVGQMTCRVATDEKLVALTFDDGPTPQGVEAVLPTLDQYGVKATFFLVGEAVARQPILAQQLRAAGHELGNHTYTHRRMLGRSLRTYTDEIERTDALLRASGESRPRLMRPPYGKRLIGLPTAAADAGYLIVMWDVEEPGTDNAAEYADRIVRQVRPGSIVLMHPMHGNREMVRDALPRVVEGLRSRGYQMVTMSELLKAKEN
jgi:peptidoglycan/xylan/chitin deacetylase (PgdA/CDA1 family)